MRSTSVRSIRLAAVIASTTIVSLLAACSEATGPSESRVTPSAVGRVRNSVADECEYGRQSDGSCRSGVTVPWY